MKNIKALLVIFFLSAFLLRLSVITLAHHGDLNNNISWGTIAYEKGLQNFYEGYQNDETKTDKLPLRENGEVAWPFSAPNQPPLTIEMFAVSRFIWQKVRDFLWFMNWNLLIFPSKTVWFWDEKGMDVMVKLPSLIADLGIGVMVYHFVTGIGKKSQKTGVYLTALWLFNPLTWYNSSIWGQTDPVVNFMGFLAIYFLYQKRFTLFTVIFTLSLLFKGSLTIFIPVLFYWVLVNKFSFKKWVKAGLSVFLTVFIVSVWFHPQWNLFLWLADLYNKRILPGEIGYLTANAFNFWWLVNSGKILDNVNFFGLTARTWGFAISMTGLLIVLRWLSGNIKKGRLFFALALSSLITFLFLTRIHERYLYPFFPWATIGLAFIPGYWPVYAVLSVTFLINQFNLFWVPTLPVLRGLLENNLLPELLSIANILMLFLSFRLLKTRKV